MVAALNAFSPRFRNSLGMSGKVALVVTPTAGAFWTQSHLTVGQASKDPSKYIEGAKVPVATTARPGYAKLPAWYGVSNAVYENPFKTIFAIAAPAYAGLFYVESTNPATANMPLSQRLIHTRVYGQGLAICVTAGVMIFVKSMSEEGGYRLYQGRVVREAELRRVGPRIRHWYSEGANEKAKDAINPDSIEDIGIDLGLLAPLVYVPLLPLLVVGLRGRVAPEKLQQIAGGVIGVGLLHAGSIMFTDSSMTMD